MLGQLHTFILSPVGREGEGAGTQLWAELLHLGLGVGMRNRGESG